MLQVLLLPEASEAKSLSESVVSGKGVEAKRVWSRSGPRQIFLRREYM